MTSIDEGEVAEEEDEVEVLLMVPRLRADRLRGRLQCCTRLCMSSGF